jgi:hypothetical protein
VLAAMSTPHGHTSGVVARLTIDRGGAVGVAPIRSELHSDVIDCRIATPRGRTRREFLVDFGLFRSDPRIRNQQTLSHIRLEIPDVPPAGVARKFYLEATFGDVGDPASRTMHVVNTRSADGKLYGSGTVGITRTGGAGRFAIDARTQEGVALTGTIDCSNIEEG